MIAYRSINRVSAITFDLDDTLYDNMPYVFKAQDRLREYLHQKYPATQALSENNWTQFRVNALKNRPSLCNDIGGIRRAVLKQAFKKVGFSNADIVSATNDSFDYFYFQRSNFIVDRKIVKTLEQLASIVPLAAITNGNVNCQQIGIGHVFSHIVHASSNYPMKPQPLIFQHTAELLGLSKNTILHVGDDLIKDVQGAIRAGYQSAWFAKNREMNLACESMTLLPHIQLDCLNELLELIG